MHASIRRALCAVGITGGIVLLGIGLAEAASADGNGPTTSGQGAILSGNQTGAAVNAPVNASGNQLTVLGHDNKSTSTGGAATPPSASGSPTTSGKDGVGSGNQTAVGVQAPVNASGNQVTVIGHHNTASSTGGAATGAAGPGAGTASAAPSTTGQGGLVSGNQTGLGVNLPVNLSGNQVTVIGDHNTGQSTSSAATGAGGSGGTAPSTTGLGGLIAGNQTGVGVNLPVNLSGNQVTVIGDHNTGSATSSSTTGGTTTGGTATGAPSAGGATTTGEGGIGSGNQTPIVAQLPVNASGNQVTVIGQDNTVTSTGGTTSGGTGTGGQTTTSGQDGLVSGNQTGITALAPIAATGDQVTVIGQDNTVTSTGGTSTGGGGTGGQTTTSGQDGLVSGNQTGITALAPIAATGDQVTVIGQDNTVTSTGGTTTGGTSTGGQTTTGEGGVGSGNQTPVVVQVPVDASGNQVTVIGQGNTDTSTSGSGGTTPVTGSPGAVVSAPSSGGGATPSAPQGAGGPGDTTLPNTGAASALLALTLLGLLLLSAGLVLGRPRRLAAH